MALWGEDMSRLDKQMKVKACESPAKSSTVRVRGGV